MIDQKLIKANKARLEREQGRLQKLLSGVEGKKGPKYPEIGSQEDENASEVAMYAANVAEGYDLEMRLKKIKAALVRMENGTYGLCVAGGEEIPAERLRAVPEAETCVEHDKK